MLRAVILCLSGLLLLALTSCEQGEKASGIIRSSLEDMQRESLPGAELTRQKCSTCHYLDRNITKVGPPLKGIVGHAPTISGVPFAVWDEKSLNRWLQDPTGIKPGTLMAIPGIKSATERTAIIEYLKQF